MTERNLNDAQREAAEHFTGPALTLAGPGSGKTTVLTERTLFLVEKTRLPERILCVTFTNAAGTEMRRRYRSAAAARFPELRDLPEPVFKTVHSFCNGLIREFEEAASLRYVRIEGEGGGKTEILRKIYFEINGGEADAYLLNQITGSGDHAADPEIRNLKQIRIAYEQYKRRRNLIDFDDMIGLASAILHSGGRPQKRIREQYQERFQFIQVDEAQDLTEAQFEILQTLAAARNLFVVADDDQSIYGFRGASPACVGAFYRRHPDCKLYCLSRNYRSTQNIVRISETFISKNTDRFDKDLYSEKEPGRMPQIRVCRNSILQAEFIGKEIKKLRRVQNGLTTGILYRNNTSGLLPAAFFTKENIPYYRQGEIPQLDTVPFVETVLREIRNSERGSGPILPRPDKTFRRLLENGLERDFESYCRETRQHLRYKDAVLSFLLYLCSVSASWREAVQLLDRINARGDAAEGRSVCLSTVHSAKGLEYDAVFLIDAIQGEFPGSGASCGKMLEEERRLFYVGLTRARKYLYVTVPLVRGNIYAGKETEKESVFVSELRDVLRNVNSGGRT